MTKKRWSPALVTAVIASLALVIAGCGSSSSNDASQSDVSNQSAAADETITGESDSSPQENNTLVIDTTFTLQTIDPQREFETTGNLLVRQMYESALKFDNGDPSKPVANLADYSMSSDNTIMTLTMKKGSTFSDGTPVTADDVVFSYKRLIGIQGNPSFLLDGVTVEKVDDDTITLTSDAPNPALPYILPSPTLGVVNSKVVKENGGTTTSDDDAKTFLDHNSAGSGPYQLVTYDPQTQVVLELNPNYEGPKPKYDRVVVRNVEGAIQKTDLQSGTAQIAVDLSPDQIDKLDKSSVNIFEAPAVRTIYSFFNQDPSVNKWTANPQFDKGVKAAIDYKKIVETAGGGAKTLIGVVPSSFLGALPEKDAIKYDPEQAKQDIDASGYDGSPIEFYYPNDVTYGGVALENLAVVLQAQLKAVGVELRLKPGPAATLLDSYRAGKQAMGMWSWGADFPDPSNYLVFTPGENVGKRANWTTDIADPSVLKATEAAVDAKSPEDRKKAYETLQMVLNEKGPFIPLIEPALNVVTTKGISKITTLPAARFSFASVS